MEIFPCDNFDVDYMLSLLDEAGFVLRYVINNDKYIHIKNFTKHQMPHHKEVASEIPAPEGVQQITRHAYNVSNLLREQVFIRDNNSCLKCDAVNNLSIDHIVPLAKGGTNEIDNLQTLCGKCNSSKGDAVKDYRKTNVDSTLTQCKTNVDSSKSLIAPLNPESLILKPETLVLNPESSPNGKSESDAKKPVMDIMAVYNALSTQQVLSPFDTFWQNYPTMDRSKGSKKDAEAKFKLALKKVSFNEIMEGLRKYTEYIRHTGQKNQDAFRWLEKERWADDYTIQQQNIGNKNGNNNKSILSIANTLARL